MADDEAQQPEDTSWWASATPSDSSVPTTTFDEPLVWPESSAWDDLLGSEGEARLFPELSDAADDEAGLIFPPVRDAATPAEPPPMPDSDARWRPADAHTHLEADPEATVQHAGPLAGLGGGAGPAQTPSRAGEALPWPSLVGAPATVLSPASADERPLPDPALGSIWSNDFRADPQDLVGFAGLPAPAIDADTERHARGGPMWRRLDVRSGNAAVIGLISIVSLVLLGMFLSVRARNDVRTDATQGRPAGDELAVTGPLNTIPLTTTATTIAPGPTINIAELVPPTETTGGADSTGSGGGTGATATTAPARTTVPGNRAAATTTPATQPTATTEPPPPTTAATTPTTQPVDDTQTTTTRRPIPTFTIPTFTIPDISGFGPRERSIAGLGH